MQSVLEGSQNCGSGPPSARWAVGPERGPRLAGGGPLDLSQAHNGTRRETGLIRNAVGGSCCRVLLPGGGKIKGGGKRGQVSGYSPASRRRLLERLHQVDRGRVPADSVGMLTLTWPAEFPDPRVAKACLKEFVRRLRRVWGRLAVFWKLEPQKRGAPHFHLLVFWGLGLSEAELKRRLEWCAGTWHQIAGGGDPNHLKWHLGQLGNRPCLEVVGSWEGVLRYAGKYVSKPVEADPEDEWLSGAWVWPGRFWGLYCPSLLPRRVVEVEVPSRVAYQVKRVLRRYIEHQPNGKVRAACGSVVRRGPVSQIPAEALLAWAWDARDDLQAGKAPAARCTLRPYHRRVRRSRQDGGVGILAFLPDSEVRRVVRWAYGKVLTEGMDHASRQSSVAVQAAQPGRGQGYRCDGGVGGYVDGSRLAVGVGQLFSS